MAQQQKSGKPWSGTNKIPTVKQFVENLDKDKKDRDRQIDEQTKASHIPPEKTDQDKITPHVNEDRQKGGKWVTDPVTGNQVMIADVGQEFMKNVEDPKVSPSNTFPTPIDMHLAFCTQPEPRQTDHRCYLT